MKIHNFIKAAIILAVAIGFSSCRKYLDLKPNNSLVIPQSLNDCQLLLDDYTKMNAGYPSDGEASSDNYYLTDVNYNSLIDLDAKNNYIWAPEGQHANGWTLPYKTLYNANLVLQLLEKLPNTGTDYNTIKGTALFFRAFAFFNVTQLFTKPYNTSTAGTALGIPLRLSPDLDAEVNRGNLQQTYDRILQDLKDAVQLLPVVTSIQTRPNKVAAYAALARTYLAMQNYENAGKMANEALGLYNTLVDYKSITKINRFNPEVIFQAVTAASSILSPSIAKIDDELYSSYQANDKRKTLFFRQNTGANTGTFSFSGSYDGTANASLFTGFATDELYLIRAESYARAGNTSAAMNDLNTLLKNRWDPNATIPANAFIDLTAANADDALSKVLIERRKELVFRNTRWTDIRRLNQDPNLAPITLKRTKNTINYPPLLPGDLRYAMLLPINQEISLSGLTQNPR